MSANRPGAQTNFLVSTGPRSIAFVLDFWRIRERLRWCCRTREGRRGEPWRLACGQGDRLVSRRPMGPAAASTRTRTGHLQQVPPGAADFTVLLTVRSTVARRLRSHRGQGTPASGLSGCNPVARQLRSGLAVGISVRSAHPRPTSSSSTASAPQGHPRPWLSVAIRSGPRAGPTFFIGMGGRCCAWPSWSTTSSSPRRPGCGSPGAAGSTGRWPGLPQRLHLDNAAGSAAARRRLGCAQVRHRGSTTGRSAARLWPSHQAHERALMQRLEGLPGATGSSPRGRGRKARTTACPTWRFRRGWPSKSASCHHSEHQGLFAPPSRHGGPLVEQRALRQLAPGPVNAQSC